MKSILDGKVHLLLPSQVLITVKQSGCLQIRTAVRMDPVRISRGRDFRLITAQFDHLVKFAGEIGFQGYLDAPLTEDNQSVRFQLVHHTQDRFEMSVRHARP